MGSTRALNWAGGPGLQGGVEMQLLLLLQGSAGDNGQDQHSPVRTPGVESEALRQQAH